MPTVDPIKHKPRVKRYAYDGGAQCHVDGEVLEIKLLNISISGIQFASRTKIATSQSIKLQWNDPNFGDFLLSLMVKREVYKPENTEYQYYYGSQYFSLDDASKQSLVSLLKYCSQEEKKALRQQAEKITPTYLFQVIDEGREFLNRIIKTNQHVPHFDGVFSHIVDYEKASFKSSDEVSRHIQKLTTHHFHCQLLNMLGPIVAENIEWKLPYFLRVNAEIQKMSETENEVEGIIKKLMEEPREDDENKKLQIKINESSNRLFYAKQSLLEAVMEVFSSVENESPEVQKQFGQIKETYEKIRGVTSGTNSSSPQVTYDRRVAESSTISDVLVDILTGTSTSGKPVKVNVGLFLALGIALVGLGIYTFLNWGESNSAIQAEMGLTEIQPIKNKKFDQQINLTFRAKDWKKLSDEQKLHVMKEILAYLKKDGKYSYCVLYDNDGNILEVLFLGMPLP